MKFDKNLSDFNRLFAAEWMGVFPKGVDAFQSEDGTLLFRGPIAIPDYPTHIGTHVAVSLDQDVEKKLSEASPADLQTLTEILICSLGSSLQAQFDPNKNRQYALEIIGTMNLICADSL